MQYKYLALGCVVGVFLVSQARAQDRWSGLYAGLTLDSIEASADVGASVVHQHDDRHATIGDHAGYNFGRDNGFVWGPKVSRKF